MTLEGIVHNLKIKKVQVVHLRFYSSSVPMGPLLYREGGGGARVGSLGSLSAIFVGSPVLPPML